MLTRISEVAKLEKGGRNGTGAAYVGVWLYKKMYVRFCFYGSVVVQV